MPRRIDWREKAVNLHAAVCNRVLEKLKTFEITHSNSMACAICPGVQHKMRYRLLKCSSAPCMESSQEACEWRGKTLTCLEAGTRSVYEYGGHNSSVSSPRAIRFTPAQKEFCRKMAAHHLRPVRIHHALARKFDTPLEGLPALSTVQNFVNYYSRKHIENYDRVDSIKEMVNNMAFNGSEPLNQAFSFGWEMDGEGNIVVGNGFAATHGHMAARALTFTWNATYKTNQCDYPVVVVGISGSSRAFHLVALTVVSQETEAVFQAVLLALKRVYVWVTQKERRVRYALADADQAQYNALQKVFGDSGDFQFLMCFFHLMENVHKAMQSFPSGVAGRIVADLYDLRFARSAEAFVQLRDAVLRSWASDPSLVAFSTYMARQWLYGRFCCWQAFVTPSGYATTNNPVETFNAVLKRDYTLRRRLKMGASLHELSGCCAATSEIPKPFNVRAVPAKTLARRAADMRRGGLLTLLEGHAVGPACAGALRIIRVLSMRPPRISDAPNKRSELGIAVQTTLDWK